MPNDVSVVEAARHQVGGNSAVMGLRADLAQLLPDFIKAETAAVEARLREVYVALQRVPSVITEQETADRVADQIGIAATALADLEAIRVAHKQPLDALAAIVHDHCKTLAALITRGDTPAAKKLPPQILEKVRLALGAWTDALRKAEETRLRAEQAEAAARAAAAAADARRLNEEAEELARRARTDAERAAAAETAVAAQAKVEEATAAEKVAAAPIVATARTQGQATTAYVPRAPEYDIEVTDIDLVPRVYLTVDMAKVKAAIETSENSFPIPGIKATERAPMARVVRR